MFFLREALRGPLVGLTSDKELRPQMTQIYADALGLDA